jgi:hypothetical protein
MAKQLTESSSPASTIRPRTPKRGHRARWPSSSLIGSASALMRCPCAWLRCAFLPPQPRTNGYLWRYSVNRLFTCAINHHAVVLAAQGRSRLPVKEASRVSRLGPKLKLEHERQRGQKTSVAQPLKAIRGNLPRRTLRERIRFC